MYIPRKEAERGLIAIEGCIELLEVWVVRGLGMYAHGSEETLLQVPRRDRVYGLEATSALKKKTKTVKRQQD